MLRQHFKMIAELLGEAKAEAQWGKATAPSFNAEEVIERLVDKFAARLGQYNPRFDAGRFREAVDTRCDAALSYMDDDND